jgi:PAS domain S-box-containing protein
MLLKDFHDRSTDLIASSLRFVTQDMASLQREMRREYNRGFISEADQVLSSKGVNTRYQILVAIDDQGTILHATQFALKGLPVAEVLPAFDRQRYNQLQQFNRPDIAHELDKQWISVYIPLVLERRADEIRPLRTGALFAIYDLSEDVANIWQHILYSSLPLWLLTVFILLTLIGILHYFVTRPMESLVLSVQEIARGNYEVQSHFKGHGEFAHLGDAFNRMSDQLKQRSEQREQAEAALRESERRFRALVESAPIGFYETDALGNCLYVNEKWQELAGLTFKESLGEGWQRALYEEDRDNVTQLWTRHAQDQAPWDMEYRFCTPDGQINWLLGRTVALRDQDDRITGYLGANLDITELKQAEKALRRSQKMDAIGQLTGGIAHDFNNILGAILGNIELLELKTAVDDKTQNRFDTIKHSIQRAVDLTKQLLSFSRNDVTDAKVININAVIENMKTLITRSLTPEVEVKLQLAKDLWPTEIDPGDFGDALLNLVLNARDAMSGGGMLSIETSNCSLDASYCALNPGVIPGEYVQLAVSDNGTGISAEVQERIFEPFFTTKPVGKGTGLGLAMVFGFVRRSRGNIKLYSESGIGTTFRLYLPRASGQQQVIDSSSQQSSSMPRGQETILVVDDESALLELVRETLQLQGYNVLTATNGKLALEILVQEPGIELLFSDVVMPGGMNGYELAEQACLIRPDLKVMLTSGYTEMAVARNGQARFNANLLSKPYTLMTLTQRVREILD